jgi:hypothetical protein
VPQHLNPLADRRAANARVAGAVATAFIIGIIVFGGFYLGSRSSPFPTTSGTTSAPESQPRTP